TGTSPAPRSPRRAAAAASAGRRGAARRGRRRARAASRAAWPPWSAGAGVASGARRGPSVGRSVAGLAEEVLQPADADDEVLVAERGRKPQGARRGECLTQ